MQGTFDFKFIGNFFHQFLTLWQVTIIRQIRKSPDFIPVNGDGATQNNGDEFFCAITRRLIFSGLRGNEHAFKEQILRIHHLHLAIIRP
jgi:hypothetical protein